MALIPRNIEAEFRDILASSRAAAILGPRQAGKSTLAGELQRTGVVPHYYNLDDEETRKAALADPACCWRSSRCSTPPMPAVSS